MTKLAKNVYFKIIHLAQSGPKCKKVEEENPLTERKKYPRTLAVMIN